MKIHGISLISAHIIQLNDKPANPVFKRMRERERERVRQIIYEINRHEMMIRYESSENDVMRQNNYILVVMYAYLRPKLYNRRCTLCL